MKSIKKIFTVILTICLCFTSFTFSAFAADPDTEYDYEVSIINPYCELYSSSKGIIVYIETDNPDPDTISLASTGDAKVTKKNMRVSDYFFPDLIVEERTYYYYVVDGGYIFMLTSEAGEAEVTVQENGTNTDASVSFTVLDYTDGYTKWMDDIIYDAFTRNGLDPLEMSVTTYLSYLSDYIDENYTYYENDGTYIWYTYQHYGTYWQNHQLDSSSVPDLMAIISEYLGIEGVLVSGYMHGYVEYTDEDGLTHYYAAEITESLRSGRIDTEIANTISVSDVSDTDGYHTWSTVETSVSCTGTETLRECTRCKTEEYVFEESGAEHTWDEGVTTEAACTEDGQILYTCTVCGATKKIILDATGHIYSEDSLVVTKEPTCTSYGLGKYLCEACGQYITKNLSKAEHDYVEESITEPTCTEDGEVTYTCTVCGDSYTETLEAAGHSYDDGVITKEAADTEKGEITYTCTVCGETYTEEIAAYGNGLLKNSSGIWAYYTDGEVDTAYTGLAKNDYGWWYINAGYLDTTYTGLAKNDYGWWYVTDGKLDLTYTGMAKNAYGWWYVTNGSLDLTYTGLAVNDYGTWYMVNGSLASSVSGMTKIGSAWVYLTNGMVNTSYTGLADNDYGTWYINAGYLDTSASGMTKAGSTWVYLTNGMVDTTYTGLAKNDYGWWYINAGYLDLTYTGMAKNDYGWWYVTDGKLDLTYTGMAKNDYGWWYMTNGSLDTSYTGLADNDYGTWYMVNGRLTYYTGTVTVNGVKYTVKNGLVVS